MLLRTCLVLFFVLALSGCMSTLPYNGGSLGVAPVPRSPAEAVGAVSVAVNARLPSLLQLLQRPQEFEALTLLALDDAQHKLKLGFRQFSRVVGILKREESCVRSYVVVAAPTASGSLLSVQAETKCQHAGFPEALVQEEPFTRDEVRLKSWLQAEASK